jgi:hypothetical protein
MLAGNKHSNSSFLNVNFTKKVLLDWARPEEREREKTIFWHCKII